MQQGPDLLNFQLAYLSNLESGYFRNREPTILENGRLGFIDSVH